MHEPQQRFHAQIAKAVVRSGFRQRLSVDGVCEPGGEPCVQPKAPSSCWARSSILGIRASGVSASSTPHEAHLTKDCSTYDGTTPSLCTIADSDLGVVPIGTKVWYLGPVLTNSYFLSSSITWTRVMATRDRLLHLRGQAIDRYLHLLERDWHARPVHRHVRRDHRCRWILALGWHLLLRRRARAGGRIVAWVSGGVTLSARSAALSRASSAVAVGAHPLEATAVADVHDRRGRELFGLCRRLGLDEDEANDAVQEAFLRMWAESARGSVINDPEAWAFRVTYRLAMDHHRLGRMVRSLADRLAGVDEPADLDPDDRIAVWAAVDKLPPRQRAVIYLRYRADLSYDRIGTVMGITANGARNDASVATAALRKRYASEEGLR